MKKSWNIWNGETKTLYSNRYSLLKSIFYGTSRGQFLVQTTKLAENKQKGDEMNYLIGIIFLALIGYIFEQRRHIKFLKQVNFNQETRHIMTDHEIFLLKHQIGTYVYSLETLGYSQDKMNKRDYTRHEPSPEHLQKNLEEFQRKQSIYRSKNIKFETELELRGVK